MVRSCALLAPIFRRCLSVRRSRRPGRLTPRKYSPAWRSSRHINRDGELDFWGAAKWPPFFILATKSSAEAASFRSAGSLPAFLCGDGKYVGTRHVVETACFGGERGRSSGVGASQRTVKNAGRLPALRGGGAAAAYTNSRPPSTARIWPVTKFDFTR